VEVDINRFVSDATLKLPELGLSFCLDAYEGWPSTVSEESRFTNSRQDVALRLAVAGTSILDQGMKAALAQARVRVDEGVYRQLSVDHLNVMATSDPERTGGADPSQRVLTQLTEVVRWLVPGDEDVRFTKPIPTPGRISRWLGDTVVRFRIQAVAVTE
jgi:hypothetical protein